MDALEYRVWGALRQILKTAYPLKSYYEPFVVTVTNNTRTVMGSWKAPFDGQKAIITITNMNLPPRNIIFGALHSLSHHANYAFWGKISQKHDKRFYQTYQQMISAAYSLSIITPEMIKSGLSVLKSDEKAEMEFIRDLDLEGKPDPNMEYKKDMRIIQVFEGYEHREWLCNKGFRYNIRTKGWEKEIHITGIEQESRMLTEKGFCPSVCGVLDMTLYGRIVLSGDTYHVKERLKANGYRFRNSSWAKDVLISTVENEILTAKSLIGKNNRIKIAVNY